MTSINNRKPNRLSDHNYDQNGFYFITICTKNKKEFFGKIENGEMRLNGIGGIINDQWLWLAKQYDYVLLDEYVIMPNHFHGIININDYCRDRSRPVPTGKIKSLSELIGAFKTTSSKLIHQNGYHDFFWQRSFYDHIIRTERSLDEIRKYIYYNPLKWDIDRNNTENLYM